MLVYKAFPNHAKIFKVKNQISKLLSITFNKGTDIENKKFAKFLYIFTELGSTIGAVLIIAILTLISGVNILYVFIPIYLFQLAMVEALKITFKRPRPESHMDKNLFGVRVTSGSFPSGHTSNVFALAFLVSNFYELNIFLTTAVFAIAGFIAYSRVLLGKHFTIDIAAGAICGLSFAVIGSLLLPYLLMYIV